jgi:hypothetical protein
MKRLRMVGLLPMAILLVLATGGCGGSDTPAESGMESGCAEANALKDSLTALTQLNPVGDGVDALRSAAAEVGTDLDAAVSAASSNLQPAVDRVSTAYGNFEAAREGVSSEEGLGAAATGVGSALNELGTALTGLRMEISENCLSGT